MEEIKSPCINVCQYDSKGVCFGCRRTLEEAGAWSAYSNEEKERIVVLTYQRRNVEGEQPTVFLR